MSDYEVVVGNVGTVYSGPTLEVAESKYRIYEYQSKSGAGRAAGEPVYLFKDGDLLREYNPPECYSDDCLNACLATCGGCGNAFCGEHGNPKPPPRCANCLSAK